MVHDDPCPHCQEPGCAGDCLVGAAPSPGDFRRAWLRAHPDEQEPERGIDMNDPSRKPQVRRIVALLILLVIVLTPPLMTAADSGPHNGPLIVAGASQTNSVVPPATTTI